MSFAEDRQQKEKIMEDTTSVELIAELKKCYGEQAEYREGQLDAIMAVLDSKRTLVVQKTGWGKSLVYFMATKMIRKKSSKFTLIISPLLVLMDNQIDSAFKLGLNVQSINSTNTENWKETVEEVKSGAVDALIISPERLANHEFKKILSEELADKIGLFVVDEAHCISDWGHDFRPDYRRIIDLVHLLPSNVGVLATTATANDRVVNDIKAQLGENIVVSRGGLIRESIAIDTVPLDSREERLVWLNKNINKLPGTGVIYCLTVNDCKLVEKWLNSQGISCKAYYAELDPECKDETLKLFMNNQIKTMVATVAFGMGYDKPDIGFVVHFQRPGNIVAYYQQIGRAGRQIENAYAILLYGNQDDEINEYFIESAFPTESMMRDIIDIVSSHPGIKKNSVQMYTDMKYANIEKSLKYLEVNGDIYIDNSKYYKTPRIWKPDLERSLAVTKTRKKELENIIAFSKSSQCYMEFIAKELDDHSAHACGKCSNCLGRSLYECTITPEDISEAQRFIKSDFNVIEPRKQWPNASCSEDGKLRIASEYRLEQGIVLSNYGDAGWGREVSIDKYKKGTFRDEIVTASYKLLKDFVRENNITVLTYVPSLRRPILVRNFAERLANKLGLEFFTALEKTENVVCQKSMNNSFRQWKNANDSFAVVDIRACNILLVDDMVDSRWTFTCCGYKLLKAGCGKIYPFALANSAGKGSEE